MTADPLIDTPAAAAMPDPRRSTLSIWVHAARPHTLPAAVAGVAVGLGAGLAVGAPFRADTALGCVLVLLAGLTALLNRSRR